MFKSWSGPPTSSTRQKSSILQGRNFYVLGSLNEVMLINDLLEKLGGKRAWAMSRGECVLMQEAALQDIAHRDKLRSAVEKGIPVVDGKSWLMACAKTGRCPDFGAYALAIPPESLQRQRPSQPGPEAPPSVKSASDTPSDSDDAELVSLKSDPGSSPKACAVNGSEEPTSNAEEEDTDVFAGPTGLPDGASSKPIFAKHGRSRPAGVQGGGFVRELTTAELHNTQTTIHDYRILHCCVMSENKNKYYVMELTEDNGSHRIITHYGRTDDLEKDPRSGRREVRVFKTPEQAKEYFAQLCTEKYNIKKYRDVALLTTTVGTHRLQNLVEEKHKVNATANAVPPVRPTKDVLEVVDHLYSEASTALSSVLSAKISARGIMTPLGVLSKNQIDAGANILAQLHSLISSGVAKSELTKLSSEFYSLIPHRLGAGMADVSVSIITTDRHVQDKLELLQLMRDISKLSKVAAGDETLLKYSALNNNMTMLNPAVEECNMVKKIVETQARNTGVKVTRVFRISNDVEQERFDTSVPQRVKLLHGSRPGNFVGILSRGLLLPKAASTTQRTNFGWLGAGVYFSDAGCSMSRYAARSSNGKCYAVVATVSMGTVKEVTELHPQLTEPPAGYDTVKGLGKEMPGGPKESIFDDNEYVVYRENRYTLDYLVEMDIAQPLGPPKEVDMPLISAPEPDRQSAVGFVKKQFKPAVKQPVVKQAAVKSSTGFEFSSTAAPAFTFSSPTSGAGEQKVKLLEAEVAQLSIRVSTLEVSAGKVAALEQMVAGLQIGGAKVQPAPAPPAVKSSWKRTSDEAFTFEPPPQPATTTAFGGFGSMVTMVTGREGSVAGPLSNEEISARELTLREKYARGEGAGRFEFLIDVYADVQNFKYEDFTPQEQQSAKILYQYVKQPAIGAQSVVTQNEFMQNMDTLTNNQFKGLNWNNLFLAGGGVLGAMMPSDAGNGSAFRGSDLDLFMYGISTDEEALAKVKHIIDVVTANRKKQKPDKARLSQHVEVVRTPHAITIVGVYPNRHVQIVLRMYKSPSEVLIGFDIDACTVGFDGTRAWANPRARRAINKQINLVDMTRRSLTYEVRLAKYAKRGFAVAIPDVDAARLVNVNRSEAKSSEGLRRLVALNSKENDVCAALRRVPMSEKFQRYKKRGKAMLKKKKMDSGVSAKEDKDWSGSTEEESILGLEADYCNVLMPYGPCWNYWNLESYLCKKDKSQYFANGCVHRHIAVYGDKALEGQTIWCTECKKKPSGPEDFDCDIATAESKYVFGRPKWMRDDPGRQLMTGSFHPVTDDRWFEGAVTNGPSTSRPSCVLYRMGIALDKWAASGGPQLVQPSMAAPGFGGFNNDVGAVFGKTTGTMFGAAHKMAPKKMPTPRMKTTSVKAKSPAPFMKAANSSSIAFGVPRPIPGMDMNVTMYGNIAIVASEAAYSGGDKVVCLSMHMKKDQYDFAHIRNEGKTAVFFGTCDCLKEMVKVVGSFNTNLKHQVFAVAIGSNQEWYSMPNPMVHTVVFSKYLKIQPAMSQVVYVGDKAREYHDMDYKFAANCGMDFQTPACYFKNEAPACPPAQVYDPRTTLNVIRRWMPVRAGDETITAPSFCTSEGWMVLMVGPPGAGKSSYYNRHLKQLGMALISRDIQDTMESCVDLFVSMAATRCSVVIDNLNSTREKRQLFIKAAKDHGYKVGCIILETPTAVAKHMNKLRPWTSAGKVERVPDVVYGVYTKEFQQPNISEGFEEGAIHSQPFVPEFDTPFDEKCFMMLP
eukprot:TRINITY_DN42042_c0_g1_i1.p1 TRINITY_DN42042_c0_g1~~TRINITY_DN42042_c0_g1_i1.p1  ORF type:complete len:1754 (+),score=585.15 TRINITY_DN42042_c0_g1_i1:52-5313(+)